MDGPTDEPTYKVNGEISFAHKENLILNICYIPLSLSPSPSPYLSACFDVCATISVVPGKLESRNLHTILAKS